MKNLHAFAIAIALVVAGAGCAGVGVPHRSTTPKPPSASMWIEPADLASRDLYYGPWGAEHAPDPKGVFELVELKHSGVNLGMTVKDAQGREWSVKQAYPGGLDPEGPVEVTLSRLLSAVGYHQPPVYYLPAFYLKDDFGKRVAVGGRFRLKDPSLKETGSWKWDDNPFVGTRELTGLKLVMMLLSNWDSKDRRDVALGSNTAIFVARVHKWPRSHREAQYLLTDWGGAMGRWGSNVVTRGRWDVDGFEAQTPQFVTGVKDGRVLFGYTGQRTADIAGDIPVDHVRWFHSYASRLTERQLVDGLLASGATDDEAARFARALINRIKQLGRAIDASGMTRVTARTARR